MDTPVQDHVRKKATYRICFVTETYPPEINGVAMTLQRLITGLISNQHKITLIRPKQKGDNNSESDIPLTLVPGVPLPGYNGLQLGIPFGNKIKNHFLANTPDIVYIATEGPLGKTTLKLASKLKIPVISGFHTNFHTYMEHYRAGLLKKMALSYLKKFHNQTSMTLVPSDDIKALLEQSGFRNINILERGVDCSLFNTNKRSQSLRDLWGLNDMDPAVLYVGRLAAEKNISLFIECINAMHRINPATKGIIVGNGPLYERLRKENPHIIFCGEKTGESLAIHYASADIFLFPSETETFGNVTLEAMASGLNVLAFNYAAAKRHITEGSTGFLAKNHSATDFIEKSLTMIKMKNSERQVVSSNSRAYTLKIDWQHIIDEFETYLQSTSVQTL